MKRLIVAAALMLSPHVAFADHTHGEHGHAGHGAAQTMLTASTPSDGAILAEPPRSLALMFGHPVNLQSVTITGPSGAVSADFRPMNDAAASYNVALPAGLAAGNYAARWTASGDGHEMSGVINFIVQ
jgi:methionine-rich copper-binding protein CopC